MFDELLVALSGPMGSGKSTVAEGLKGKHKFHIISIGTTIKKVSKLLIDDQVKLKTYLESVLKGEENFQAIYGTLIETFKEKFNYAEWERKEDGTYNKNQWYRDLTQFTATYFRELYGEDIWMRFVASDAMNLATSGERVVCDDLRFPGEKKILEMFGFRIVRLDITKEEQKKRLANDYGEISDELLNHATETSLNDAHFDYRLLVDGFSVQETQQQVYQFLGLQ